LTTGRLACGIAAVAAFTRGSYRIRLNISKIWQLAYTVRVRQVDVLPGTLPGVESIQQRFGSAILGTESEFINRVFVVYDTPRPDDTPPR
jgi:hypothetical protein